MEIIFFGQLADIAGKSNIQMEGITGTDTLKATLEADFPGLKQVKYMLAVDKKMITSNTALTGCEMIALMPPFSGG